MLQPPFGSGRSTWSVLWCACMLLHVAAGAWTVSNPTSGLSAVQYGTSTLSGLQIAGGAGTTSLRLQVNVGSGQVSALASTAGMCECGYW
jgi:hypothetical protein